MLVDVERNKTQQAQRETEKTEEQLRDLEHEMYMLRNNTAKNR